MQYHDFFCNTLLISCIFILRKVDDMFSALQEFKWICFIMIFCSTFDLTCLLFFDKTLFVVLGYYQYVNLIGLLICLYLTAITGILQTLETSSIIPFSMTLDCLDEFESAIIQDTSSEYFYEYLYQDL
jgi:hypothetical protein